MGNPLFNELSPLGYTVCCSKNVWEEHIISKAANPIMKNNLKPVRETITNPEVIYRSNQWPDRDVYFKRCSSATYGDKMFTKVIVQTPDEYNNSGSVVSAWPQRDISGNIDEKGLKYVRSKL